MSLQNLSKSAVRVGKNYLKGYTDTQIKVREATANEPWGPSGAQMAELAQLSYNQTDFIEIMEILDKLSLIHISEPTRPSHISRMPSSA